MARWDSELQKHTLLLIHVVNFNLLIKIPLTPPLMCYMNKIITRADGRDKRFATQEIMWIPFSQISLPRLYDHYATSSFTLSVHRVN